MRTKSEVLGDLRNMLRDIFVAKSNGETHARLARAHGYVDGYMRALIETGLADKQELVEIVAAERERSSGPAMRPFAVVADPFPSPPVNVPVNVPGKSLDMTAVDIDAGTPRTDAPPMAIASEPAKTAAA
ncbi:MAG: hypothetical protein IPG50_00700 [Myxococcales bacterium]|nr:hypothetical protein [Myxococcales bacterium]